ncbi:MAG: SDR family NAD(P)-dependent oxidoreductase [Desulfosudaceae bacterium]
MSPATDRVLVVTGEAREIGRAICRVFAAFNTHVYFNCPSSSEAARDTVQLVADRGGLVTALRTEVTSEDETRAFFSTGAEKNRPVLTGKCFP